MQPREMQELLSEDFWEAGPRAGRGIEDERRGQGTCV